MNPDLICYIIAPLLGFLGMLAGGYWGVGCNWLVVPSMLLMGLTPMEAIGVGLLQMVPAILPSVVKDAPALGWKKNTLGLNLVLPLALASIAGSTLGCPINVLLHREFGDTAFQCMFISFMLFLGIKILSAHGYAYQNRVPVFRTRDMPKAAEAGIAAGFLSSLLGIGGGVIFRPLFSMIFKIPENETANATRLLLGVTALAGGISYFIDTEQIKWSIFLLAGMISIGGFVGFPLGIYIHHIVYKNGYAPFIQKSFGIVPLFVVINLSLNMIGFQGISRLLMAIFAIILSIGLTLFATYAQLHPKNIQLRRKNTPLPPPTI